MIIRVPTSEDWASLAATIDPVEAKEAVLMHGQGLGEILRHAPGRSTRLFAGLVGDNLLGIGGLSIDPWSEIVAMPWFLRTQAIEKHRAQFLRHSRQRFVDILDGYEFARQFVLLENVASIRWLEWLGWWAQQNPGLDSRFIQMNWEKG